MLKKLRSVVSMRFNRRSLLFLLVLCTFMVCFSFWSRCLDPKQDRLYVDTVVKGAPSQESVVKGGQGQQSMEFDDSEQHFVNRNAKNYNMPVEMEMQQSSMNDIECEINKEYTIQCRREDQEVYLPFSFIQKHFEVYGEIDNSEGTEKFVFSNSYSLIHQPSDVIRPDGVFFSFVHYNVELRKRVKCITAIEGVPVSTQWESNGHYYPIQIAQFGLSHYSKYLTEGEPDVTVLLDGDEQDLEAWTSDQKTKVKTVYDQTRRSQVVEFQSSDSLSNAGMYLMLKETSSLSVKFDLNMTSNGSVSVTLKSESKTFHLHYVFSNTLISCDGRNVFYGLGESRRWKWIRFSRDVDIDLLKGLQKCDKHRKAKDLTLIGITVRGRGFIDNVTISTAVHMDHFINAANWFVNHQDSRGGWPIMVTRRLIQDVMELPPGWYSAMAQGHAMSTLVRAYLKTKNPRYLESAVDGLQVFEVNSAQGGVKAKFADKYDWYEEYPTTPSSFVLNGFIYSLFGLYDLKQVAKGAALTTVTRLYDEGMKSLKAMLLMFDSGIGTFYDLRHISVGIAPNRARWDYHTTHISQLLQLARIDADPLFPRTAKRWEEYMSGKRSPHN